MWLATLEDNFAAHRVRNCL